MRQDPFNTFFRWILLSDVNHITPGIHKIVKYKLKILQHLLEDFQHVFEDFVTVNIRTTNRCEGVMTMFKAILKKMRKWVKF